MGDDVGMMDIQHIAAVAGCITAVTAALVVIYRIVRWSRNITEGIRCLLRSDMLHTYYKHVERGTIRQYEAEEFNKSYAGYKALDGNSFIDDVAKKVKDWEITT